MDAFIYFISTSGLLILVAAGVTFFLGLWLGWLIWAKYHRLYHELTTEAAQAKNEAAILRQRNIQLEDSNRQLHSSEGGMVHDLREARERIERLENELAETRQKHLKELAAIRSEHGLETSNLHRELRTIRFNAESELKWLRESAERELTTSQTEVARLSKELDQLSETHAKHVKDSKIELTATQKEVERLKSEHAAEKNSEIHGMTAAMESLRACRIELNQCKQQLEFARHELNERRGG